MQFARTTCEWSQFSTNILHTDSGRSEVVSKIKTIRWPEQCTFLDFRNFAMHTFTNRCSSASFRWLSLGDLIISVFVQAYVYKSPGPGHGIHPRILDETRSIIAAPLKKYLKPHYYLKNYLTIGELQIFQPFIKMAINQNFEITVLSVWLVLSANSWKEVRDYY